MKTSEDHRRKVATPMFALYQPFYLIEAIVSINNQWTMHHICIEGEKGEGNQIMGKVHTFVSSLT